ncbi:MAG TPA: hypothetical protein VK576_00630 [Thermoleophilia bacterium]|nr:hypothetical protein [Thermoleophilia bacterium]
MRQSGGGTGRRFSRRYSDPGIVHRDWIGDGVLTILFGGLVAVAVFLPWANAGNGGQVNFSASAGAGIKTALEAELGWPTLLLALAVVVVGVTMLVFKPTRLSLVPCLAVSLAGIAIVLLCAAAGWSIWRPMRPGLGLYLATLGGVLLVPTGLASALVGYILTTPHAFARFRRAPEPADPPVDAAG